MTYNQAESALVAMGVERATARKFLRWVHEHIDVWKAFERRALESIHLGKMVNAKGLLEDLRRAESIARREDFKINNDYGAYLARLFVVRYPQHRSQFEFRQTTGLRRAA